MAKLDGDSVVVDTSDCVTRSLSIAFKDWKKLRNEHVSGLLEKNVSAEVFWLCAEKDEEGFVRNFRLVFILKVLF